MTINQYSIIILRDDVQADLPGAPTSLNPLTYAPGLEPGEPNFCRDTGRLFIGHDPSVGQKNFRRTSFPYQNVEVITENSTGLFSEMAGSYLKEADDRSFYKTVLPTSSLALTDPNVAVVTIPVADGSTQPFRIYNTDSMAVFIDYAAFRSDGRPVKMGRLRVMQGTGNATPVCSDDGVNLGSSVLTFSATEAGPVGGRYVVINYRYATAGSFTFRFRLTRPTV